MADKAMDVYLNDHFGGATFGSELARQIEAQSAGTELETQATALAMQIEEDLERLSVLMERMEVTKNPVKKATTWLAEKLSRAKLTGISSGERELGLFIALETLSLGVEGKASLWRALKAVEDRYPQLDAGELDELIARAEAQREVLEKARRAAVGRTFTPAGSG
jgi:hypothetical protein